ncbi:MAG: cation transporter [Hyphomicrobiales bacterium]|nr:MAG: cation transporter [Hyphomicrobiales bacterium]
MNDFLKHDHQRDSGISNERRVLAALIMVAGFMLVEVAGGIISGSLALLADSAHMLTDAASLLLTWIAYQLARRPADQRRTYGYSRFQILAAFTNGITLFGLAGLIIWEAIDRIMTPQPVLGKPMLIIAAIGLVVNLITFFLIHSAEDHDLNMRGAMAHVMGDILASLAALIAAGLIWYGGWVIADPILSLLVALLLIRSAWQLSGDSGHILLEGAPAELELNEVVDDLMAHVNGLRDVHHVHVWMLTEDDTLATLHARVDQGIDAHQVLYDIKRRLSEQFGINHATVQLEFFARL